DGKPEAAAGRRVDDRVAGLCGRRRAAGDEVVAVYQVGGPGRAAGRGDQRVQLELAHDRVDALLPRLLVAAGQRLQVGGVVEVGRRLGLQEQLLAEPLELGGGVRLVEGDGVRQGPDRDAGPGRQVPVQVGLELEE